MSRGAWTALLLVLVPSLASAEQAPLALRRARLYEVGVGYFERQGRFDAQKSVALPVPITHLDDALRTLVILHAEGKGQIAGIEFSSTTSRSLARALAGLPEDEETPLDYLTLLRSLKGAPVAVRVKTETLRGRVVDVLDADQGVLSHCVGTAPSKDSEPPECTTLRQATVLLLTESSELRRLLAADIQSVHPLSPGATTRIEAALDAVGKRGAQGAKALRVLAQQGQSVTLGYVAETPVWRSSYRLVLDQADMGLLSGWALIHNDTDEAWKGVQVELVNGQPDSYIFPLAAPRYARRKLVTPDQELSTVPQLLDEPVDEKWAKGSMWGDEIGDSFGSGGLGLAGTGEGGGGRGEGIGLGSIGTLGHGAGEAVAEPLADTVASRSAEQGALFSYTIGVPVELRAHGSALVPFVQTTTLARRTAWFTAPGTTARSAVYVTNQTKQTLPSGTIALFADGGFAGESALLRLKPGQSQLIAYGTDLDVEFSVVDEKTKDATVELTVEDGALTEHFLRTHENRYSLINNSGAGRTVYVSLPFLTNAVVKGPDETADDAVRGGRYAVYQIEAQKTRAVTVHAEERMVRSTKLGEVTLAQLVSFRQSDRFGATQRKDLERVIALHQAVVASRQRCVREEAELTAAREEIAQVREDLKVIRDPDSDAAETLSERLLTLSSLRQKRQTAAVACAATTRRSEAAARSVLEQLGRGR
jgi:hypothetical protein